MVVDPRSEHLDEFIEAEFGFFVEDILNYHSDGFLILFGNGCCDDLGKVLD